MIQSWHSICLILITLTSLTGPTPRSPPAVPTGPLAFFVAAATTPQQNVVSVGKFMALDEVTDLQNKFQNTYLVPPSNELLFLSISAGALAGKPVSMAVRRSGSNTNLLTLIRADGRQTGTDTLSTSGLTSLDNGRLEVVVNEEMLISGYRLTSFSGFSITDVMRNPIESFDLRAASPSQISGYITWDSTNQDLWTIRRAGVYFIAFAVEITVVSVFDMRLEACGQEYPLQRIQSAYNTRDSMQTAVLVRCSTTSFGSIVRVNSLSQSPSGSFQNARLFGFLLDPKHTRPIHWHVKQQSTASEPGSTVGFGEVLLTSGAGTIFVEGGSVRVTARGYYLVHLTAFFDPSLPLEVEVLTGRNDNFSTMFGIVREMGISGTLDVIGRSVVLYLNANDILRVNLIQGTLFPSTRLAGTLLYLDE